MELSVVLRFCSVALTLDAIGVAIPHLSFSPLGLNLFDCALDGRPQVSVNVQAERAPQIPLRTWTEGLVLRRKHYKQINL